jgi:hypothetical protein
MGKISSKAFRKMCSLFYTTNTLNTGSCFTAKKVKQSYYRPGKALRVPAV